MSTLNTFGFNVRRKRNTNAHSPLPSKQEKTTSVTPILAFTAPTPPIAKPKTSSPINKTNTKSKTNKQQLHKDPKQSTLLPFFAPSTTTTTATTTSSSSSPATIPLPTNANPTVTQSPPSPPSPQASNEEENEICLVKRHVTMNELLPMLMDAFGEYSANDDDRMQQQQQSTILLQVKPSKTMMRTLPLEETMEFTVENGSQPLRQRRRRSSHVEEDETETLRTAFTKSLSLVPVKKRLCGNSSVTKSNHHHQQQQGLFENGHERHLLEDEFNDQQQQQEEDNEIHLVRRCLSPGQVNSLLLDIANEYLAFENNTWCASYIGGL